MKKRTSVFVIFCTVFFFSFSAFMAWFIPSYSSVRSKINETYQMLDMSRGREAKQQAEYDSAVTEFSLKLAELEELNPLADEAEEALAGLKARRKELRLQKQELEKAADQRPGKQEDDYIAGGTDSDE